MPITMHQVRAALYPEEPDYAQASQLGPEALDHLEAIIQEGDPALVSKAIYLASLIEDNRSAALIMKVARSDRPEIRVVTAAAARNLPPSPASDVLLLLLDDDDIGVRKTALDSTPVDATPELRTKIQALTKSDPDSAIRTRAGQALGRLGNKT